MRSETFEALSASRLLRLSALVVVAAMACGAAAEDDAMTRARARMIEEIEEDVRQTARYLGKSALEKRVMEVMARVPRHEFLSSQQHRVAYLNQPLPIGEGQTISQPYIVALMTDLAELEPGDRVLEIGTGSGYQAAVLAELAKEVYTVEIVEALASRARQIFERLGYRNITARVGDGGLGWPEKAPFDAIVVTAACPEVPEPLVQQLRPGGVMVAPISSGAGGEDLAVLRKRADGTVERRDVLPVRFVPLTGEHGRR